MRRMITKQQILDDCRRETEIIKHLATKLPEGALDWRPTPGQRTTLELMRYMTAAPEIAAIYCITGNWDHGQKIGEASEQVTADSFADAMDRQLSRVQEVLGDLDEAAATTKPAEMPWKEPTTQSVCVLQTLVKSYVAYRMQFFLYAKQAGNAELSSLDCWAGVSSLD